MNDYKGWLIGGAAFLAALIVGFIFFGNARYNAGRADEKALWVETMSHVKAETTYVHTSDTVRGPTIYVGHVAATHIDTVYRTNWMDTSAFEIARMAAPFETVLPLDSGSSYWVKAYPKDKDFDYNVRLSPLIVGGQIRTIERTVLQPTEAPGPGLWWGGFAAWQANPGFGASIGFGSVGVGGISVIDRQPIFFVQTHFDF